MHDELADLKQRHQRLSLLYQVSNVIHSTLDSQKALELILGEAVRLTKATSGSVVLINPTTGFLEIQVASGLPPGAADLKLRVGEGITGWVARTGKPARVGKVREDPRYIVLRENVHSEMVVPLIVADDLRGLLNVDSEREDAFTAADQELLEELANQAAKVIHHTWLYEQIRHKAALFVTLANISQTITSTLSLDETLQVITREACSLMKARVSSVLLLDESGEWLGLRAHHGGGAGYLNRPQLSVSDSLVGTVVRRKRPSQVENVQISSRYQSVEMAQQENLVSLLSVPLVFGDQAIGALNVYTAVPHTFSNEEIRILTALAGLSAIAIEKARLYERVAVLEDQLRQNEKLSALGLLAAEVAHEIRNPLTVMKMLFHSLDLRFDEADPRATDARVIGEKMEHLNRIVEQILRFARTAEPQMGPVDLSRVLEDLGLLVRYKLRQHNIELEFKIEPDAPAIAGDAAQLSQAFLNLVLNAIDAMAESGRLVISLRRMPRDFARPPTHIVVEFKDTGGGMTEEQRQRAFTSLLSTTRQRGTGLGLALVSRIVEAHQGRVSVHSSPGKGSNFRIVLPVNIEREHTP